MNRLVRQVFCNTPTSTSRIDAVARLNPSQRPKLQWRPLRSTWCIWNLWIRSGWLVARNQAYTSSRTSEDYRGVNSHSWAKSIVGGTLAACLPAAGDGNEGVGPRQHHNLRLGAGSGPPSLSDLSKLEVQLDKICLRWG